MNEANSSRLPEMTEEISRRKGLDSFLGFLKRGNIL